MWSGGGILHKRWNTYLCLFMRHQKQTDLREIEDMGLDFENRIQPWVTCDLIPYQFLENCGNYNKYLKKWQLRCRKKSWHGTLLNKQNRTMRFETRNARKFSSRSIHVFFGKTLFGVCCFHIVGISEWVIHNVFHK